MWEDESICRYFAYMNLFVAAMLLLVMADNLLLLYLGWEGVGLHAPICWWASGIATPITGKAARKAFVVTRVGDTAMALGLCLLFTELGTLDIQPLMASRQQRSGTSAIHCPCAGHRAVAGRSASANQRSYRCTPGCLTPWPARPRSAH